MNILTDWLPETVEIEGTKYPINTDFRASVHFELMMQNPELSDQEKVRLALLIYYPKPWPHNKTEAVNKLLWFYRCGKEDSQKSKSSDEGTDVKKVYSFDYDDDYIYAAFMQQYQIDLQDVEGLHWWKFRALFKALPDDCQFCKIMGYRSMRISNKMSKEQKAFYKRMQALYALPVPQEEQEKSNAIAQALINGGDLTGLL